MRKNLVKKINRNIRLRGNKIIEMLQWHQHSKISSSLPLIISIHIPKTAGTTFRHYLRELLGWKLYYDYGHDTPMTSAKILNSMYKHPKQINILKEAYAKNQFKCIHGHFPVLKYLDVFQNACFITWIRNPVERVISHYFYHKNNFIPDNVMNNQVFYGHLDLLGYAQMEENRNIQTKMLYGLSLEKYSFVGLTESFTESYAKFIKIFNIPYKNSQILYLNQNTNRPAIDIDIKNVIEKLNMSDMDTYLEIKEKT